ncbi:hypothetical protein F4604DRAFT_1744227 [Suillus subluteus]|nr:hypothetical protein F4604DRAFT_1744227 [Suillus subluteus]
MWLRAVPFVSLSSIVLSPQNNIRAVIPPNGLKFHLHQLYTALPRVTPLGVEATCLFASSKQTTYSHMLRDVYRYHSHIANCNCSRALYT